ncbi:MAG: 50S ribosomal protein L9 [Clostridia bacterium]
MKVILAEDIKELGKKNQMVEVSEGYARNFLFKKKLAIMADVKNVNIMKDKMQSDNSRKERDLIEANILKSKLADKAVDIFVRAGENGRLFGSITSQDIADAIRQQLKSDIDKRKIILPDSIKNIGTATVTIKIHSEVSVNINVNVKEKE